MEILPFMTIRRDLESIMLSELSQTEKDKYCGISHMQPKKPKLMDTENRLVVARGRRWEVGKMSEDDLLVINKSGVVNVQHGDCSYEYCIIYLKVAERVDLKSFHHNKKSCNYVW